jgi:acetolactate synthase small subunit
LERTEKELKVTAEDLEDTRGKLEHMTELAKQRDLEIKSLNKVGLVDLVASCSL